MRPRSSLDALALVLLIACSRDPAYESGKPERRPAPRSADEAAAGFAEKRDRAVALEKKGLCAPESIRNAPEPDERFWHCRGEDWDGTTHLKEMLARFSADPRAWQDYCSPTSVTRANPISVPLCDGTSAEAAARKAASEKPIDPWDWQTPRPKPAKAGDK